MDRMPSGIPQLHVLAARGDVQLARQVAVESDASAELHPPAAHRRRHIVEPNAARRRSDSVPLIASSAFGSEKWRMRPSVIVALPGEQRLAQRTVDRRGQLRAARAAHVAEESLQDAEIGVAAACSAMRSSRRPTLPDDAQPRVVADQLQLARLSTWLIAATAGSAPRCGSRSRTAACRRVSTVPSTSRRSTSASSPDDADRSAGDGGRERRQLRHEQPHVRIERAVVEPERELRVGLRRQRDAARAGERQPRRRGVDLAAQLVAAQRERAGDLPDAFFADEQIVDAEPDVVARRVERAAAAGRELGEPDSGARGYASERDLLDRNAPAVGVERVGRIPADERRAGDRRRRPSRS